ncbi:unnamed protein product [Penicillium roqueforti FM164]|uniref:Genomic scaffold, ProqFM164S01 n=1 Tax=Penicillium roqueforti (strain FM164) TaxID=1365484 RepID=W6PUR1_PENRF|nr:unnamed protein product [Penicillium roqueforti FM164]
MEHLGHGNTRLSQNYSCDVLLVTSSTDLPLDLGRLQGIQVPLGFSADREIVRKFKGMVMKATNILYGITLTGRRLSEEFLPVRMHLSKLSLS